MDAKMYFEWLAEKADHFSKPQRRYIKIKYLYKIGFSFKEVQAMGYGFSPSKYNEDSNDII